MVQITMIDDGNMDLSGKTILITGATAGIGKATGMELAKMGADVILVGRDSHKTQETVAEIKADTGNTAVTGFTADLSVKAEIFSLAEQIKRRYEKLDVLLNNAGGFFMRQEITADGFEMSFALNHLNYFLLTQLLLDTLKASPPARIINVSSDAHRSAKLDFDNLQGEQGFNGWQAYARSKLMNVLFTYELHRRLDGDGITVNALHPGFVRTNFGQNNSGVPGKAIRLAYIGAKSPEEGAETSVYLASSPEVAGLSGLYFTDCQPTRSSEASYDEEAAYRLWEISRELTGH
jgi:NAD(P)-dependent dehydrogenase (short-subunit alcohol dehydrogenase family)